jgi:hypothetical protein
MALGLAARPWPGRSSDMSRDQAIAEHCEGLVVQGVVAPSAYGRHSNKKSLITS